MAISPACNDTAESWMDDLDLNQNLPGHIQEQELEVLESHKSMWTSGKVGEIAGVDHRIVTTGGPVRQHP
jgi:hypothetical protein